MYDWISEHNMRFDSTVRAKKSIAYIHTTLVVTLFLPPGVTVV